MIRFPKVKELIPVARSMKWDEELITELASVAHKHRLTLKVNVLYLLFVTAKQGNREGESNG